MRTTVGVLRVAMATKSCAPNLLRTKNLGQHICFGGSDMNDDGCIVILDDLMQN
jgi:hypothetical protein